MTSHNNEEFENFMAKINELQQMQELEMESLTKERERHNELRQSLRKVLFSFGWTRFSWYRKNVSSRNHFPNGEHQRHTCES
jgi:hypothetical protein